MFRSGGTATTAIIGTVAGTIPTPQLASAQVVSPSAHDSAAVWRLPLLNGTTVARSRAGSAAATKRQQRNHCSRASMTRDRRQSGDARGAQSLEMVAFPRVGNPSTPNPESGTLVAQTAERWMAHQVRVRVPSHTPPSV